MAFFVVVVVLVTAVPFTRCRRWWWKHHTSALHLASIMEASGTVLVTTDLDGLVLTWNGAAQRILGWSAEEVVGSPIETRLVPDQRVGVVRELRRQASRTQNRNQRPWRGNISTLCLDGRVVDLAVTVCPVTDRGELVALALVGAVATHDRDAAVMRDRDWQLAESQRLARLGSWSLDIRADTVEWSDETFRIFGLAPGELVPSAEEFLQRVHPEDRATLEEDIRLLLDQDESRTRDFRIVHADGSLRWVHGRASLERDAAGAPVRMVGTIQDITDAVAVANDLAAARDLAISASQAKSEFLAMMSHEIRTPLNAIVGFADLLVDNPIGSDVARMSEGIQRAGEALLRIVNDVLDSSKIEAGKLDLEVSELGVGELVDEVAVLVAPSAGLRGLRFMAWCAPELTPKRRGDRSRLRQVLLNLASNAVKFTDQGEVSIQARAAEGDAVCFSVVDTGIGIAPQDRERLFDPFVQADSSTTRRHGGTGLGLSIARRLAEAMGGRIDVQSILGEGSTFCLTVPLPVVPSGSQQQPAPVLEGGRSIFANRDTSDLLAGNSRGWVRPASSLDRGPTGLGSGSEDRSEVEAVVSPPAVGWRGRVLLVEDNWLNQQAVSEMLRRLDLEVDVAIDGIEAAAAAAARRYDAVFMDCHMPNLDGYEATRRIRAAEAGTHRVPIIALTASALEHDRERCIEAGMDDIVAKPVHRVDIETALRRVGLEAVLSAAAPPTAPVDEEVLDAAEFAALRSIATLGGLVKRFAAHAPTYVANLRQALEDEVIDDLALTVHTLKGEAAILGANRVASVCGALDAAVRKGALDLVPDLIDRLDAELSDAAEAMFAESARYDRLATSAVGASSVRLSRPRP